MATEGKRIRARRERLQLTQQQLSDRIGGKPTRQTIVAIEGGAGFQYTTLKKITDGLDAIEAERGITEPVVVEDEDWLEFEVRLPDGSSVVMRSTVENRAEMEGSVLRLLHGMSQEDDA
ncbi:MAG TPA: helix-turn-helix transcriptional regulator [Nocardioidaceae bacterium]|nr:helix-turn-helix transcriptional regulator [Nocardioidaceae bacterium]